MTNRLVSELAEVRRRTTGLRRRAFGRLLAVWSVVIERTVRPRAALSPVTSVTTFAAWAVAGSALACAWAGQALGWEELRASAWFLFVLLALSVLFVVGRQQVEAVMDLSRHRVVVGERANGRLLLTNNSRRRTLPMMIELPVGRTRAAFDLPSLGAGVEHEELFAIPTNRRAILDLGPVHAVRTDPMSLLRRDQALTEPELLHVHPRTVRIEGSASGFIRDLEGQTVKKVADHDVAFHALREYIPGDDRRFIHWKSSARTGTLMVRQFDETRRSHLLVALSTRLDDYANDEEFELAVSVAGSLGAQTLRDGHTLSAMTSTAHLRSDHATLLLDQLSGVDYEPPAPRLPETLRRLGRDVPGASVAVLICGSVVESVELRRARRMLGPDVRTLVVQNDIDAEVTLRTMADLDLAAIGSLEDLPGTIRRLAR